MAKETQSQWNFGELFPEEQTREVLTVSELTTRVKRTLESRVGEVWVEGEITGLRAHGSGHIYFSVKDAKCQLACVLFRSTRVAQRELMEDGQQNNQPAQQPYNSEHGTRGTGTTIGDFFTDAADDNQIYRTIGAPRDNEPEHRLRSARVPFQR